VENLRDWCTHIIMKTMYCAEESGELVVVVRFSYTVMQVGQCRNHGCLKVITNPGGMATH
jgi:hypothetical protein